MQKNNKLFTYISKKINKYDYYHGDEIISTDDGDYFVKKMNGNEKYLYDYLLSRNFKNFLDITNNYDDQYKLYQYRTDNVSIEDKAIDLVNLLSLLHIKTTTYREIDLDNVKKIYETVNEELDYLDTYYHNMQDFIETRIYMSPAEYLLIRNISSIYYMLSISKTNINKWYEIKSYKKKERVVLAHNNLSLNNFIDSGIPVFKNWENAKKDFAVYDFYKFYRNNYNDLEFSSLFEIYQSKYKFTDDELILFKAFVFKIWKVEFTKSNYDNCVIVSNLITYMNKTFEFFLEEDKEDEKTNDDKLN